MRGLESAPTAPSISVFTSVGRIQDSDPSSVGVPWNWGEARAEKSSQCTRHMYVGEVFKLLPVAWFR